MPFLLVSGSSDGSMQVWTVSSEGTPGEMGGLCHCQPKALINALPPDPAELQQKIDTKGKFPLALELSYLPASSSKFESIVNYDDSY